MKTALIVGGSGLVGGHLRQRLLRDGDWRVISTQRRLPASPQPGVTPLALDVCDPASVAALADLREVTHVFFLARVWQDGYVIGREQNVAALARVLDAIQDWPSLRHVQLVHGLKWYGSVDGPFPTAARESDPRPDKPHFYYEQRDLLAQRQRGRAWGWATLRPHCVTGLAVGSPSNLMLGIGVYAAAMQASGRRALPFPASREASMARIDCTDAGLLSDAMVWAATTPAAQGCDCNVANGDTFSWESVWPAIAACFGMTAGPPEPLRLAQRMPEFQPAWARLAQSQQLAQPDIVKLVDWNFMDATLALQWDQTMSLEKLRGHGFVERVDTRAKMLEILRDYRRLRVLPAGPGEGATA